MAAETGLLRRPIPKSGETLPAVGLGTAVVFNGTPPEQRRAVVKALLDTGGKLIDTAPSYGEGEGATGAAVAELDARKRTFLATKIGTRGRDAGIASLEASLKTLRTDQIDLMQVHNLIDTANQLALLREYKAQKKFRYIGVTHSNAQEQEVLTEWLEKEPMDFVQLNYALDVRDPEKRLLPMAADKGVAVLVNLPFGRNRLLRKLSEKPLPGWAKEVGATTWPQLALKYVISHPAVTVAIPGTRNPAHMAENVRAAGGAVLTTAQRQDLVAILEKA